MKKLLISMLAVATLASCAKEETLSFDKGEAIQFGNAFVDNATRANDPTYGAVALTKFNVYGTVQGTGNGVVNIFDGDVVTGAVGQNVWSSGDVKQYWIADAIYNFAAVVDVDKNSDLLPDGVTTDANGMPETITYTTANQNDLLYATAGPITGLAKDNQKVNFTFSHLLAKAQFTVKSNTEGGYYYSVKNIKVSNYSEGIYTIGDTTPWAVDAEDATEIEFGHIEKVTKDDNGKTNATQMLLIPTTTDFKVSFTVEIWNDNGDDEDVLLGTTSYTGDAAKIVSQDLEAGHVYDFNLDLKVGELIQFTVTQKPTWDPAEGGTEVTIQ